MYRESTGVLAGMAVAVALLGAAPQSHPGVAPAVTVKLSEWNVVLSQASIAAGPVTFVVTNAGSIPHGFEVEGQGIEKEIEMIQPGASDTLTLTLKAGSYDVYCPVGSDSHKKLGVVLGSGVVAPRRRFVAA
jgi:iron uptake system EfeUOB component EfeO/EfeM